MNSAEDLHSLVDLRKLTNPISTTLWEYYVHFLSKPHSNLGRSGAVCPFVPFAVKYNTLWTKILEGTNISMEMIEEVLQYFKKTILSISDQSEHDAFVLVLPDLQDYKLVDIIQHKFKEEFVRSGLMIGEFHPKKETPGLWSSDFFPLKFKYPMLVVRRLLEQDKVFMLSDHYSATEKKKFLAAYERHYTSNGVWSNMTFRVLAMACCCTLFWIYIFQSK